MKHKRWRIAGGITIIAGLTALSLAWTKGDDFQLVKSINIFCSVFREMVQNYADEISPEKMVTHGINCMLQSLDPYSVYYPEEESRELKQRHSGKYAGVGASIIRHNNTIYVMEIMEGSPAQRDGLKKGDIILAIDSVQITHQDTEEVGQMLRGEAKTEVTVTVKRKDKIIPLRIRRDNITIPNVPYYGMTDDSMAYIKLTGFTNNAAREVKNALKTLKKNKPKGIILDLRDNPGGLLTEAIDIVNLFIEKGKVIVTLKKRNTVKIAEYRTQHEPSDTSTPLAVLVNQSSASAAEIVAGAIQDLDRGIIIGQKTFGKGLVQTEIPMPYNSFLNLTTSKYYIPSGRCIQTIDYFTKNHETGATAANEISKKEFNTLHGRPVTDGGGISPDLLITPDTVSYFVKTLIDSLWIFKYSNEYALLHPMPPVKSAFAITPAILNDFTNYLIAHHFSCSSPVEQSLRLIENYFKTLRQEEKTQREIDHLRQYLNNSNNLSQLVRENSQVISSLLYAEICEHYYYRHGKIDASLKNDKEVQKATGVLNTPALYKELLFSKKP